MKKFLFPLVFFILLTSFFFYKTIFLSFIPFPGDLLVGGYEPYKSYPFLGYAPGGYPNKAQDFDVLELLYPGKEFSIRILKEGVLPLWNPFIFSGSPHLASLQSGSFYPFNILFFIFPISSAWSLYIIIQPTFTAFFTYLLLKKFRLSILSSIFGSVVFAYSSYQVVWMEYGNIGHTIMWLPLAMWLVIQSIEKPTIIKSLFLSLVLSLSILAGYVQTTFYVFVFLSVFIVFYTRYIDKKFWLKKVMVFVPIFILPLFFCAVQILPTLELIFHSSRLPYEKNSFFALLIPQFHLATLFVPDFFGNPATRNYWLTGTYIERVSYVGVIPLVFSLYACLQKRTPVIWFFIISLFTTYFLAFDSPIGRAIYSFSLPFIQTAVPTRIMFVFCFAASILAAFGLEEFQNSKKIKPLLQIVLSIGCIYTFLWFFVFLVQYIVKDSSWITHLMTSKRNLILPSLLFGAFLILFVLQILRVNKKYIMLGIFVLTVFDLFYFFQKITPFSPKEAVYPKTEVFTFLSHTQGIDRSWGYGSGYIEPNIHTHEKLYTPDGYDALHIKRYGEFLSASYKGQISSVIPGADANIAGGYGDEDLRQNQYRQKILNILGVKYVLNKKGSGSDGAFDKNTYALIWEKDNWQIYENEKALPRIFLAQKYVVEKQNNKIIEKLFSANFDARNSVILEEQPTISSNKDILLPGSVSLVSYDANKVVVKTNAETSSMLFLSDNYFPGWRATVDGKEEKIYRANYTFRAVPVSAGEHTVMFMYYPSSFDKGVKITTATLFVLVVFIVFVTIRQKNFYV